VREIVEVALSHFTCFMFDGDSKLRGNCVYRALFWKIKMVHTFLQVAVVLSNP
jgi:hypothetical protein